MRPPEWWVARVWLKDGAPVYLETMTPAARVATLALVNSGDLILLPDGRLAEPVECYETELEAAAHRAELMRLYPKSGEWRIILNADL